MKYSLRQLSVFDAVASQESVSAAAKKLSMTQSAVSMSLSQFENILDRQLFIRQGNRLTLSYWGRWLRPKAKKLLQDAQQIEFGLHDQHIISGHLSICASQTPAEYILPELISKIDENFPNLCIELKVKNTDHVIQTLLNHQCELGIIEGRLDDSRLLQEKLMDDHLIIFCSPFHPYANNESVNLSQLEHAKWVLREVGAGTRCTFEGAMHGLIDHIDVWKSYENVSVLKALVANGLYLGCLPHLDIVDALEKGQLVALNTPDLNLRHRLSFVWHKDAGDNPLRDCILLEAKRLVSRHEKKQDKAYLNLPYPAGFKALS
ncbi:transcriptional regulator, LysR family protein [Psychromonas sp. CNPT3]|uniref:LysR substrate-binding domain-containing protein n=1 Tax=Psychromonas sp. CNPT3 TaxID=314282 RepID=UPI00006E34D0|nr:LysR substrate-binding domain-containing protein [Psychromonas sp. CNPT3]AGH81212.1 transcriptional regulator, LysR family protein [Psychromonas sp. CNPT3]